MESAAPSDLDSHRSEYFKRAAQIVDNQGRIQKEKDEAEQAAYLRRQAAVYKQELEEHDRMLEEKDRVLEADCRALDDLERTIHEEVDAARKAAMEAEPVLLEEHQQALEEQDEQFLRRRDAVDKELEAQNAMIAADTKEHCDALERTYQAKTEGFRAALEALKQERALFYSSEREKWRDEYQRAKQVQDETNRQKAEMEEDRRNHEIAMAANERCHSAAVEDAKAEYARRVAEHHAWLSLLAHNRRLARPDEEEKSGEQ